MNIFSVICIGLGLFAIAGCQNQSDPFGEISHEIIVYEQERPEGAHPVSSRLVSSGTMPPYERASLIREVDGSQFYEIKITSDSWDVSVLWTLVNELESSGEGTREIMFSCDSDIDFYIREANGSDFYIRDKDGDDMILVQGRKRFDRGKHEFVVLLGNQ